MAAPRPLPTNVDKILIIHTAFLGDIVLATPFLAQLRKVFPDAEIQFLTTPSGVSLLSPNPWNIRLICYDKKGHERGPLGLWKKIQEVRKNKPDLVFCLHRSFRSALISRASGGEIWGFRESAGGFLFHHQIERKPGSFEAEKNLSLLRNWIEPSNLPTENFFPKLNWSEEEEQEATSHLAGRRGFVAMAPGSVWATKRWPAERFGALAYKLWKEKNLRVVIVGSADRVDVGAGEVIGRRFIELGGPETSKPLNLAGKTSLGALKSVLSKAKLVVSNDSSPLHISIAVGIPVLGIFGPTTRELGFFPLAREGMSTVSEIEDLDCRPCGLHGHHQCPQSHFRCMLDLSVERVFNDLEKLEWA